MKQVFVIISLMLGCNGFAQIKIDDQPGEKYYEFIKTNCQGKLPSEKELLAMKPSAAIPDGFLDTLKKYDWVELGGYSWDPAGASREDYFDKSLFANEAKSQYQFNIKRVLNDGMVADFSIQKFQEQLSTITTTSFSKYNAPTYSTQKLKTGISYIKSVSFGEASYLRLMSYKNNVLVYDINRSGKITDIKTRFRVAFYAIPKQFKWEFKE